MKNRIVYYITFLLSLAFFSSCKKQLELLPSDIIVPDKAFTSVLDLQKALLGVYAANGGGAGNRTYIGGILSDEAKMASSNRGQGQSTYKWQYSGTEAEHNADFLNYYSMIDAANKILAVIDNVPAYGASETNLKKRIKAELYVLRAIAHFECLVEFMPVGYTAGAMGVPVVLKSSQTATPARNTVGEVINQVSQDLALGRAETNIPTAPDDVIRLSQATIAAYQARVALLTNNWPGVIARTTEALNFARQSGRALTGLDNQLQEFSDYWSDANEVETLWKFRNQATPQGYWFDTNGDVFFQASDKLIGDYDQGNDIRFVVFFTTFIFNNHIVAFNKYPGSQQGPQINDLKLVRMGELYLNMAEGYAQQSDLPNAAKYLDTLRSDRIFGYTLGGLTFASKQDAIDQTLDERYKELCFEGFRFFDLKRNSLPIDRQASDVGSPNWQNLPATDHRWALPIPQHEIFANKNMKQNPGY